jgi:putative Mn2+ efflux pump MntP
MQDHLESNGIRATPEGLFEIDSGRVMVFIPRADVVKLSLAHGRLAERPFVQAIIGALLLAFGALAIGWLLLIGYWKTVASAVVLPIVGLWMLVHSFRDGDYLEVQTPRATRKLVFHPALTPQEAIDFTRCLKDQFQYP